MRHEEEKKSAPQPCEDPGQGAGEELGKGRREKRFASHTNGSQSFQSREHSQPRQGKGMHKYLSRVWRQQDDLQRNCRLLKTKAEEDAQGDSPIGTSTSGPPNPEAIQAQETQLPIPVPVSSPQELLQAVKDGLTPYAYKRLAAIGATQHLLSKHMAHLSVIDTQLSKYLMERADLQIRCQTRTKGS